MLQKMMNGPYSPLGKARTLMIRKKKITERIPLQIFSSGTESSLKREREREHQSVKVLF